MSMNLHCKEMELWQTPTYITHMCFERITSKGKIIKDNWRNIKNKYILWVESHSSGVWKDNEEYKNRKEAIKLHIKEVNSYKILHFSIV